MAIREVCSRCGVLETHEGIVPRHQCIRCDAEDAKLAILPDTESWLVEENKKYREAGCKLAIAALHVINECDGLHRLALAVAEWSKAIANEGGRGK